MIWCEACLRAHQPGDPGCVVVAATRRARRTAARLRPAVLARQRGRCASCGRHLRGAWHLDHEVQVADGGPTNLSNLRAMCAACHRAAARRTPN